MGRLRTWLGITALGTLIGCADEERPREEPTEEEITELADLMCEAGNACWPDDIEECKAAQGGLPEIFYGGRNEDCSDIWLVFDFYDCKAHLGCADMQRASGEEPDTPCYEEADAAYEAGCLL
jgi:hypothetical protein